VFDQYDPHGTGVIVDAVDDAPISDAISEVLGELSPELERVRVAAGPGAQLVEATVQPPLQRSVGVVERPLRFSSETHLVHG